MLVVSYNILADTYIDPRYYPFTPADVLAPERRSRALLDRLARLDADVLCLQEVEQSAFDAIAARLTGFHGRYARKSNQKPDGCATFWRGLPLLAERTLRYADATGHVALLLEFELEGRRLGIANTHLKWDAPAALAGTGVGLLQVRALFSDLAPSAAWIACGDFNAGPSSPLLREALAAGWRDPHAGSSGFTCNANGQAQRIDYLLHTAVLAVRPLDLPVIEGTTPLPSETEPSDHLPVAGQVSWATAP